MFYFLLLLHKKIDKYFMYNDYMHNNNIWRYKKWQKAD